MTSPARRFDAILPVFAASVVLASFLAVAALATRDWDPSRLVMAGSEMTDRAAAPPGLAVADGPGYDGRYFYRLALDPLTAERTDFGITFDDAAYRQQRILYPATAWLLSLGQPRWVPWTMLAVNVVGLAGLGLLGALLAESLGRSRLWGLAIPAFPGFTMTLFRDCSEITAVTMVLAGLVGLRRGRPLVAAACLAAAVLARETTVVVAVAGLVWVLWAALAARRRGQPAGDRPSVRWRAWLPFATPLVCFAAWQGFLRMRWGSFPLMSGKGSATVPFTAALDQVWSSVRQGSWTGFRLALQILVVLGYLAWVARRSTRSPRGMGHERLAFLLYAALTVVLARDAWIEDWAFVRVQSEAATFGTLVLLGPPGAHVLALVATWVALWILVVPSLGLGA